MRSLKDPGSSPGCMHGSQFYFLSESVYIHSVNNPFLHTSDSLPTVSLRFMYMQSSYHTASIRHTSKIQFVALYSSTQYIQESYSYHNYVLP